MEEKNIHGFRSELVAYVQRRIGDFHAAEDLVQETLLRAYKARASLESSQALRGWLYRIAYHVTVDWTRRRVACRRVTRFYLSSSEAPSHAEGADAILLRKEARQALRRKVERLWDLAEELPSPYREVFHLRYRVDRSISEIARTLGIREGNVKVRLFRARKMVRTIVRRRYGKKSPPDQENSSVA